MKTSTLLFYLASAASLVAAVFPSEVHCAPLPASHKSQTSPNEHTTDRNSKFYLLLDDETFQSSPSFEATMKRIDRLGEAQDLQGLTRLADDIERTWGRQADTRGYFGLMDEATGVMRSHTFANAGTTQYTLTRKYVLATLAHAPVPLDIIARLLPCLSPEEMIALYKTPFDASDWVQTRRHLAPLWLQTRQRLKQLVDPNYDFTSPAFFGGLPSGPDDLTDRKRMIARQQAMEANNRKIQGRNDQLLVRLQDKLFSPMAEREMILYYSQAPYDTPELKRFLNAYVQEEPTKREVLEQVAQNIAMASHK